MKQNEFLKQVYIALTNVLNHPELLSVLQAYSYDEKKLRQGLQQYERVKQLTQQRSQATQHGKTVGYTLLKSREQLVNLFQLHLDTARLAYRRDSQHQDYLRLTRARSSNVDDLLVQAEEFYANIPTELMEKYHVPAKELAEAAKMVSRVMELVALQRQAQAQIQILTRTRTIALLELKVWMKTFLTIAKAACQEHPQQLEAFDIVVAS